MLMLFGVDFDAGWAERQQAFGVLAEIEDLFFGVECAVFGLVEKEVRHGNL